MVHLTPETVTRLRGLVEFTRTVLMLTLAFYLMTHPCSASAADPTPPVFNKTQPGGHLSPDGKYLALIGIGEAEAGYLMVYKLAPGRTHVPRGTPAIHRLNEVNGCAWLPGRPHTLLVTAGGADYGEGLMALWTGTRHLTMLRRARTPDAAEGYNLLAVSSDGRTVTYEHFGENSPDPDDRRNTRLRMTLPPART